MFQVRMVLLLLASLSMCFSQEPGSKSQSKRFERKGDAVTTCDMTTVPPPGSNFPKGYDYPQQVQQWVTPGMGGRVRLHGWCLFAGLNLQSTPNGPLLWQNWKTSTQAFPYQYNPWKGVGAAALPHGRPAPLNARNIANAKVGGPNPINNPAPQYPINAAVAKNPKYAACLQSMGNPAHPDWYALKDGLHLESNGDIMVAGVIYNDDAFSNILKQYLYNAVVLDGK